MKRKFFIKNLILFLIPLLIPILTLGTFSILITQRFIASNIENSNMNLLMQSKENIEMILQEIDSLGLNFNEDPVVVKRLKGILSSDSFNLDEQNALDYIVNYIDVPANSKPYINSIYVYFDNNQGRFLSSSQILSNFKSFVDISWFDSYEKNKNHIDFWTEPREIRLYNFDKNPTPVLSIYKNLYSPGSSISTGVIVLNIFTSYVDNLLKNLATYDNQSILVVDSSNKIIFKNHDFGYLNDVNLNALSAKPGQSFTLNIKNSPYTATVIHSDRYNWNYISIVPQKSLYKIPYTLSSVTFFLLVLSMILGMILSYYFTKKSYKRLQNVMLVIESAENGLPLPAMPLKVNDEYDYIMQNILKTFIEQSYLKVQVSEKKYKMQVMEMQALQSQINPHFLYNTLHTIYWEAFNLTQKPNRVNDMLSNLSDTLEYSLSGPNDIVTIDEEIKYTQSYISIMKFRYKEKFDVIWEYDSDILNEKIIKLILQPLIENSIYHGIKEKQGPGLIKIKIKYHYSDLRISIIDNGLGIEKDSLMELRKKLTTDGEYTKHIGLYNTNKRLKLKYGEKYEIEIRSKFRHGTVVYINIPCYINQ
jgi:two-component system, sensor histidine kinase YesM